MPSLWLTEPVMLKTGAVSSFWIVPVPWLSLIVAWVGLERVRVNVSFASS